MSTTIFDYWIKEQIYDRHLEIISWTRKNNLTYFFMNINPFHLETVKKDIIVKKLWRNHIDGSEVNLVNDSVNFGFTFSTDSQVYLALEGMNKEVAENLVP